MNVLWCCQHDRDLFLVRQYDQLYWEEGAVEYVVRTRFSGWKHVPVLERSASQ